MDKITHIEIKPEFVVIITDKGVRLCIDRENFNLFATKTEGILKEQDKVRQDRNPISATFTRKSSHPGLYKNCKSCGPTDWKPMIPDELKKEPKQIKTMNHTGEHIDE